MEVGSVNSASSNVSTLMNREVVQNRPPEQIQEAREPKVEKKSEAASSQQEQAPKPVVNAQGQQTGRYVNVIA